MSVGCVWRGRRAACMMVWVVCMAAAALTGCSFPEKRASEGDAALLDASTSDASTSDASMSDAWTSDGAPTWTWQVTDTGVSVALNEVYGVTASDVVAVGQDGTILHWNGSAWQSENAGTFLSLFGVWTNGGESWAVGDRGVLVRSSVRGTWTTATAPTGDAIYYYGAWGSSSADVYAVGLAGHVLHYDGVAWTTSIRGTADFSAIHGTAANDVYAVGGGGSIWRWQGGAWSEETSTVIGDLRGVHSSSLGEAYAVGVSGLILQRSAGRWSRLPSPTTDGLFDVFAANGTVWVVGHGGMVLKSDGVSAFTRVVVPSTEDLFHVWVAPTGEVFAVGGNGTALRYGPSLE